MRMNIARIFSAFGALVIIGLIAVAGAGGMALGTLRVGGPVYDKIVEGKDLVADILPPPLYVIEAYLEVNLAQNNSSDLAKRANRIKTLRADYNNRQIFWKASDLPESIKSKLAIESDRHAQSFWNEIEQKYIPAIERNDQPGQKAAFERIGVAYAAHRQVIDAIVIDANALSASTEQSAQSSTKWYLGVMLFTSFAALTLVGCAIFFVRTRVTRPLSNLTSYMGTLSDENHQTSVPFQQRSDEIGDIARAVERFRCAIQERVRLRLEQKVREQQSKEAWEKEDAERKRREQERQRVIDAISGGLNNLSRGDLTTRIDDTFPSEFDQLRINFNQSISTLQQILRQVLTSATTVAAGTNDISAAADQLANRSEKQAASLEETAAAIDQITSTVRRTSDDSSDARQIVAEAKLEAGRSAKIVDETMRAMAQIEQSSKEITHIIDVINEISFQTNLLALNAGVEAARAGEAGKGFAVVAQEVRALAQRSAQAAEEIKGLIQTASAAVKTGVSLVQESGSTLTVIVDEVSKIDTRIAAIADAAREQAVSLREINLAVAEMDKITQQNTALVEEATAASHNLNEEARELMASIGNFSVEDSRSPKTVAIQESRAA